MKDISLHKIKVFVQKYTDSHGLAFMIAIFLFAFRIISSRKFKFILLFLLILSISFIFTLMQEIYSAILIIVAILCLILVSDYLSITIFDMLNPHVAALLRGLMLSTRLGKCGFPVFIYKDVIMREPQKIFLGDNVAIYEGAILISGLGSIIVGDNSHIDSLTVIHGSGNVKIGSKVAIASGVLIYSHSNQYKEGSKPIVEQPILYDEVVIEDDVWIGAGAIVLPGVKIRKGAIVGAGTVIPQGRELKEYTIYVGVPAKPLKKRI